MATKRERRWLSGSKSIPQVEEASSSRQWLPDGHQTPPGRECKNFQEKLPNRTENRNTFTPNACAGSVVKNKKFTRRQLREPRASFENHKVVPFHSIQESAQLPRTESNKIFSLFSSGFRLQLLHSPSKPTSTRLPSRNNSKARRKIFKRERRSLPHIQLNADLSQVERYQDRYIPILPTPPNKEELEDTGGKVRVVSAAWKIKYEWEAKQRGTTGEYIRPSNFSSSASEPFLSEEHTSKIIDTAGFSPDPVKDDVIKQGGIVAAASRSPSLGHTDVSTLSEVFASSKIKFSSHISSAIAPLPSLITSSSLRAEEGTLSLVLYTSVTRNIENTISMTVENPKENLPEPSSSIAGDLVKAQLQLQTKHHPNNQATTTEQLLKRSPGPSITPTPKRLSMSAPLRRLRHSVIGTFSRPQPRAHQIMVDKGKFDRPSSTLFLEQMNSRTGASNGGASGRGRAQV